MSATIKTVEEFHWINEPKSWKLENNVLHVTTENETDFWQETWYGFHRHSGHVFGCDIKEDFSFQVCVEGDYSTLYDQAGVMLVVDDKHWMKAGIEYNDNQSAISSVLTNGTSDWGTGIFTGNPRKFWMRLTKKGNVLRVQYSTDAITWPLLRLCPIVQSDSYFVGVMCATPKRAGLSVKFSDIKVTKPLEKDLHDLS